MATWAEVVAAAPELAAAVRARFEAGRHKTLATLRRDGSPRISGIEASFAEGEVCFGSSPDSRLARDLQRDPRMALHSPSLDPPDDPTRWPGDAKLAGRAVEVTDPARKLAIARATGATPEGDSSPPDNSYRLFRIDLSEVVHTRVGDPPDHLVIESWHAGRGLQRVERR